MRSRILILSFTCALAVTLAASSVVLAQGKKGGGGSTAPNPRIQVTFSDASGDLLVSDGFGVYTDCEGDTTPADCAGLGQIWVGGSEDATFTATASGSRRFQVTCPLSGITGVCVADTPLSTDGWFLNIRGIGTMAPGESRLTTAVFSFDGQAAGQTPALPNRRLRWAGVVGSSQLVLVTRAATGYVWMVTTTPDQQEPGVGSLAVLEEQNARTSKYTARGSYQMPFTALVIECIRDCDKLSAP